MARGVQQGGGHAHFAFLRLEDLDEGEVVRLKDGLDRVEQSVERYVPGLEGGVDAVGADVLHRGEGCDQVEVGITLLLANCGGGFFFGHGLVVLWVGCGKGLRERSHLVHRLLSDASEVVVVGQEPVAGRTREAGL